MENIQSHNPGYVVILLNAQQYNKDAAESDLEHLIGLLKSAKNSSLQGFIKRDMAQVYFDRIYKDEPI
ncbi:MAG: hypothetical protein D6735_02915 [Acidobacteria bacterium]|nr:MAG: hypothetical protein D6735_02915 [Acidobacteriota bacterium]